jgi:hypothetical protein
MTNNDELRKLLADYAAGPTWSKMRKLEDAAVNELPRLLNEIAASKDEANRMIEGLHDQSVRIEELKAALRFYGLGSNYVNPHCWNSWPCHGSSIDKDGGEKARKALEKDVMTSLTPNTVIYFICRRCGRIKDPLAPPPNNYTCQCRGI